MYPLLSLFEVFLRNAIYKQISIYYNDEDWIINQASKWLYERCFFGRITLPDARPSRKAERQIERKRGHSKRRKNYYGAILRILDEPFRNSALPADRRFADELFCL